MKVYQVEFFKQNFMIKDAMVDGPHNFCVEAENIENAKIKAGFEIYKIGFKSGTTDIVAASIRERPAGKWHEMFNYTLENKVYAHSKE